MWGEFVQAAAETVRVGDQIIRVGNGANYICVKNETNSLGWTHLSGSLQEDGLPSYTESYGKNALIWVARKVS